MLGETAEASLRLHLLRELGLELADIGWPEPRTETEPSEGGDALPERGRPDCQDAVHHYRNNVGIIREWNKWQKPNSFFAFICLL